MTETITIGAGIVLATAVWVFLFRLSRDGLWFRSWLAAPVLIAYALGALTVDGRLDTVVGPVSVVELAVGLGVGAAWLVATQVGHSVLCRLFPTFLGQVNDLYRRRGQERLPTMVGAVVAMGVAEEVFFRGLVQNMAGLAVAVALYSAVQLVEGKWALVLAAVLGGLVWGLLYWWRDGLVAPVAAHVLWTGMLAFVWPLRGCASGSEPAPARTSQPATRK